MKCGLVLATAFEPFARRRINSSEIFLESIDSFKVFEDLRLHIEKRIFPVSWSRGVSSLEECCQKLFPDLIIAFGEAPINKIHLEMRAQNLCHAKIEDNDGVFVSDLRIDESASSFLESKWKQSSVLSDLAKAGFDQDVSESQNAGTFLCNRFLYELLRDPSKLKTRYVSGFIHIPIGFELKFPNRNELSTYSTRFFSEVLNSLMKNSSEKNK